MSSWLPLPCKQWCLNRNQPQGTGRRPPRGRPGKAGHPRHSPSTSSLSLTPSHGQKDTTRPWRNPGEGGVGDTHTQYCIRLQKRPWKGPEESLAASWSVTGNRCPRPHCQRAQDSRLFPPCQVPTGRTAETPQEEAYVTKPDAHSALPLARVTSADRDRRRALTPGQGPESVGSLLSGSTISSLLNKRSVLADKLFLILDVGKGRRPWGEPLGWSSLLRLQAGGGPWTRAGFAQGPTVGLGQNGLPDAKRTDTVSLPHGQSGESSRPQQVQGRPSPPRRGPSTSSRESHRQYLMGTQPPALQPHPRAAYVTQGTSTWR